MRAVTLPQSLIALVADDPVRHELPLCSAQLSRPNCQTPDGGRRDKKRVADGPLLYSSAPRCRHGELRC